MQWNRSSLLNLGNTYLALGNFPEAYRHYRQRDEQFAPTGGSPTEMLYRKSAMGRPVSRPDAIRKPSPNTN
ncbi:MAG: tetratricopeptide repeat protein [Nitrospirales bacterium]|nr:tetratricopeptide repeat-containing protein [Nitrospirales bacterium]